MAARRTKRESARAAWLLRAAELPAAPGVYLMKDAAGTVIYVGKAKNLRARVRSYFQEGTSDYRAFVGLLGGILADLETVVTRSEKEALLLEREVIRRHEPRFNIIWRDDKQYLCLRVDTSHEFPWVQVVRNMGKDGARYFGPFHSASAARQTLRVVNRHFQLRTCRDSVLNNRTRPCLEYQIGRCPAPCVLEIDRAKYAEGVNDVVMFLEGKGDELAKRLADRMWGASERLDFEVAVHYRDQLRAVQKTLEKQKVALPNLIDQDVFGLHREGPDLCIAVAEVRNGRVQNVTTQLFEGVQLEDMEVLETTILQRYALTDAAAAEVAVATDLRPPEELLVPVALESADAISEILSERRGRKVTILFPKRGDRAELLSLARENAEHGFQERKRKSGAIERTLQSLKDRLRLTRIPERIECYDISNLGEQAIVASRVTFDHGAPNKKRYRHYRIKTTRGQDDFASMYEVLHRRLARGVVESDLPDLIVVDGGKGQLNVARAVMKDLAVTTVDLVSLAKSRTLEGSDDEASRRSPERVFVPGAKDPVVMAQSSPEVLLLSRIRDEAHRFAITYQRSLRGKARLRSSLDDIAGIGPARRRALLTHLGSLKRIQDATMEELTRVPGVGPSAARALFEALHPGAVPAEGSAPRSDRGAPDPADLGD